MKTQAQRFASKVTLSADGCWQWNGTLNHHGYGRFYDKGNHQVQAHRWAYEAWIGTIPEGLMVDHLCRTRSCVNPGHMETVDAKTNVNRGRRANSEKTHCPQGHEYTESNTYRYRNGRQCRACSHARYLARKNGA